MLHDFLGESSSAMTSTGTIRGGWWICCLQGSSAMAFMVVPSGSRTNPQASPEGASRLAIYGSKPGWYLEIAGYG